MLLPRCILRARAILRRSSTSTLSPGSHPPAAVFKASKCPIAIAQRYCSSSVAAPAEPVPASLSADKKDAGEVVDADAEGDIPPEVLELFDTLRGEAVRRLDEFGPIHLFSLCWAYSTARLLDEDLQRQITGAALRLGEARDVQASANASARTSCSEKTDLSPCETDLSDAKSDAPYIATESEHWMALFKPPHWQVSVDAKEATKMAAATPFEDEDGGDDEEQSPGGKPRIHTWIRQHLADKYPICTDATEAFGLLHRLDQQTSGLLVCAKSYVGAYWLRLQWCSYMVDKEYVCVVHGWVDRSVREVHKRIRIDKRKAPNSRRTVSTHCTVGANGKPSYTELYTLAHLERPSEGNSEGSDRYSLVALKLHTGRTHQIRVHMLSIGHPLVTDSKYGEAKLADDKVWCPRNFLHSYRLAFRDVPSKEELADGTGSKLHELRSPLPEDLRKSLADNLRPVDAASEAHYNIWISGDTSKLCAFDDYPAPE